MLSMSLFAKYKKRKKMKMRKLSKTGQNLGQIFNSKHGRSCIRHKIVNITKMVKLKIVNLVVTTFRFSPVSFCAPFI